MKKSVLVLSLLISPFFAISQNTVSVNPNFANSGETLDVTITGVNTTNFNQGSGTVSFGFLQGSGTSSVNSTTIIDGSSIRVNVTVPANAYTNSYDVSTYDYIGGYTVLNNAFHVNGVAPGPKILSVNPAHAKPGETLNVTITGTNSNFSLSQSSGTYITYFTSVDFNFLQGSATAVINSTDFINDSSIIANITVPANTSIGEYSVNAYNYLDGSMSHEFQVYENCLSYYTANYKNSSNSFALTLDSVTSALGTQFLWNFGDGATSTDETPTHTYSTDAIYNVCLTTTTSTGEPCSYCHEIGINPFGETVRAAGFSLTVVRHDGTTTGIEEVNDNSGGASFIIYPNPANDLITIRQSEGSNNSMVSIYSIKREVLHQQKLNNASTEIDISSFAKGIYIVEVTSDESSEVVKLVKE